MRQQPGRALRTAGRLDEALDAIRAAIKLQPHGGAPTTIWGSSWPTWSNIRRPSAPDPTAIALKPDYAMAHCNLSQVYLLLVIINAVGRNTSGGLGSPPSPAHSSLIGRWHGAIPPGQNIFVHSEQGYGDVIHFGDSFPNSWIAGQTSSGCPANDAAFSRGLYRP